MQPTFAICGIETDGIEPRHRVSRKSHIDGCQPLAGTLALLPNHGTQRVDATAPLRLVALPKIQQQRIGIRRTYSGDALPHGVQLQLGDVSRLVYRRSCEFVSTPYGSYNLLVASVCVEHVPQVGKLLLVVAADV